MIVHDNRGRRTDGGERQIYCTLDNLRIRSSNELLQL